MARIPQIRGLILEEAILFFLRRSGFTTVDNSAGDPTLAAGSAGLLIRGRGSSHQADALADFSGFIPFSHPVRLMLKQMLNGVGQATRHTQCDWRLEGR